MALFGCASDEQFRDELAQEISKWPWNICSVNKWQHDNPPARKGTFLEQIGEEFYGAIGDDCD